MTFSLFNNIIFFKERFLASASCLSSSNTTLGKPFFGYVEPEPAKIEKRIFDLVAGRTGGTEVAKMLTDEKVLIPSAYWRKYRPGSNRCYATIEECKQENILKTQILRCLALCVFAKIIECSAPKSSFFNVFRDL